MNPVLSREVMTRFRARRASWPLTAFVLIIGLVTYLIYLLARSIASSGFGFGALFGAGFIGAFIFDSMVMLLVTAVVFVVPGVAAPSIVSERERQTFQLLQVTQMTPLGLVVGKFGASIAYVLILLAAVIPVAAIPLLFGGVRFGDVLAAIGMLAVTAITLAAIGIWMSSRAASVRGAVALSYLLAGLLAWGSFLGMLAEYAAYSSAFNRSPQSVELVSALPNPYMGMASAVLAPLETGGGFQAGIGGQTIMAPFREYLDFRQRNDAGSIDSRLTDDGRRVVDARRPPLWAYTVLLYTVITLFSLWRAMLNVQAPSPSVARVKRPASDAS